MGLVVEVEELQSAVVAAAKVRKSPWVVTSSSRLVVVLLQLVLVQLKVVSGVVFDVVVRLP